MSTYDVCARAKPTTYDEYVSTRLYTHVHITMILLL